MDDTVVRLTCTHDCPDACSALVTVDAAGRATEIRADRAHPITGRHLCVKVDRYLERVYSPARVLTPILDFEMAPKTLININFPALPPDDVQGIRVCRQGIRDYGRLRIVERTDPRGYPYYWFGLGPIVQTPGHSTDLEAIADSYISVTPLHLDLTHDPSLDQLRGAFPDSQ